MIAVAGLRGMLTQSMLEPPALAGDLQARERPERRWREIDDGSFELHAELVNPPTP